MTSAAIKATIDRFVQGLIARRLDESIDDILESAIVAEHELKLLFKEQGLIPADLYLGLIDIHNIHPPARRTRRGESDRGSNPAQRHILPLRAELQRPDLESATVCDIETFHRQWDLFTHGVLRKMRSQDWENVLAAGGSVLACILPPQVGSTDRKLNEYFQSEAYSSSFVDLFLWGLTQEQAEQKMEDIFKAVCAAAPWAVTCVRRAGVISIHTTYPFRPIQIILHLYQSPAEILAGIDVDSSCVAYDGKRVYANPRALAAMVRQANTIDVTRCSPSYEYKLAKYARRGFQIFVPSLKRGQIRRWIYDPNLQKFPNGLARLLVLETMLNDPHHYQYLKLSSQFLPKFGCDSGPWQTQIPYGLNWDANKVKEMILEDDDSINSYSNPFYDGHRHESFVGDMCQCINPSCEACDQQQDLDDPEAEVRPLLLYVKGPVRFLTGDPVDPSSHWDVKFDKWAAEAYEDRAEEVREKIKIIDEDSDGEVSGYNRGS